MISETESQAKPLFLITTLAIYQTEFWIAVGERLKQQGYGCAFLSFDDRSTDTLRENGFEVFSPTERASHNEQYTDAAFENAMFEYGIRNANQWLTHERMAFEINDSHFLRTKLLKYLNFCNVVYGELLARGTKIIVVQEVGGFLCVIASFFAAQKLGIDNWFIEPSFFRGRIFFTKNSFGAPQVPNNDVSISEQVHQILETTVRNRAIVVPLKDSHQYNAVVKKLFNLRNTARLVNKLIDKHVLRKHQEFGHIGQYVSVHLRMLKNSLQLRNRYKSLNTIGPFVYYPLHVPADMALTIRAPEYLDQLALIDFLARTTPQTHMVAIKEHPAMIGAVNAQGLIKLLNRYDNLVLLPPTTNNYDVLSKASLVVSVNSKSGAEALLTGTQVIALGDSFYRGCGLVSAVENITAIGDVLLEKLSGNVTKNRADAASVERFFQNVWSNSHPGELFVSTPTNSETFSNSMLEAIGFRHQPPHA